MHAPFAGLSNIPSVVSDLELGKNNLHGFVHVDVRLMDEIETIGSSRLPAFFPPHLAFIGSSGGMPSFWLSPNGRSWDSGQAGQTNNQRNVILLRHTYT